MNYDEFIRKKGESKKGDGFKPTFLPDYLFDFQKDMVSTSIMNGRYALFEDCGLGKTVQMLVWSHNVVAHTNKPVLILTPLAVATQTNREADKFGIESSKSMDGKFAGKKIVITNYEKLHLFNCHDFSGIVCDESSKIKNSSAKTRLDITEFARHIPYRLLCTATAAPNDYMELGTSSEALGYLGFMDMLNRFFINDNNNSGLRQMYGEAPKWRFRGHSEEPFWRWVCSWARALRKPSDIGFSDDGFILPPLTTNNHVVDAKTLPDGYLFHVHAKNLREQREEKKRTIQERCEKVAELVNNTGRPALVWCQLNEEGDTLERLIPDSIQVSGKDNDIKKEEKMMSFTDNKSRVLVTKQKIAGWGMNWQHCSHIVAFPSHSYEQLYQGIRRCWRFGQKNPVTVDMIFTEGERKVMSNLQRKSEQADVMFDNLVKFMGRSLSIESKKYNHKMEAPKWL